MGVGLAMTVAANAQAGDFTADCSGWADSGFWEVGNPANFTATATLEQYDAGTGTWTVVDTSLDAASVAPFSPITLGGTWSFDLNGTYRASIIAYAEVIYSESSKETWGPYTGAFGPFECAPPPSKNDARTPGYWKTHPESWPVTSLTLGGASYTHACLDRFLDLSTRGDIRIKLIHHLIATKLNLLPNSIPGLGSTDPSIQPTVDAADQYLISTGTTINCSTLQLTGANPTGASRALCTSLLGELDDYNNNVDIGSSGGALTAEEQGGCTAVGGETAIQMVLLPLLALFFASRRRRK